MYCVYLISYSGNKLPPFYIGSGLVDKIKNHNYMGSVSSKKYKETWFRELKSSKHLFKIRILSLYETRQDARNKEDALQRALNVIRNPLYVNLAYSSGCFGLSGKDNPFYGKCHSDETKRKISKAGKGKARKPLSDETKGKISESNKGKNAGKSRPYYSTVSPEGVMRNINSKLDIPRTQEVKDKISSTKIKNKSHAGNKNHKAKIIEIYNDHNVLICRSHGTLSADCKRLNIPYSAFKVSYQHGSKPIAGISKTTAHVKGWYAKVVTP